MEPNKEELFYIFRYVCENDLWKEFFGITKEEVKTKYGVGIINLIKKNYSKYVEMMEDRLSFGYGGTNRTNYYLRQISTNQGTPSLDNLKNIGSY